MKTYDYEIGMYTFDCPSCGVAVGLAKSYIAERRGDKRNFYCPNGHVMSYRKSESDLLKEKLASAQREAQRYQHDAIKAESEKLKVVSQYKRIRDRVMNGVCPCCNRTFQNLANHMKTQHPDFGSHQTLRGLRTALGLTQIDLADEIGINASSVSLYERQGRAGKYVSSRIESWLMENSK